MSAAAAPSEASEWASMTVPQREWLRLALWGFPPHAAHGVSGRQVSPGESDDALEIPPPTFFEAVSDTGSTGDECHVYTRSAP